MKLVADKRARWLVAAAVVCAGLAAGCGDEEPRATTGSDVKRAGSAPSSSDGGEGGGGADSDRTAHRPRSSEGVGRTSAIPLDEREAHTLPSGGVIYPAPPPAERTRPATDECALSRVRQPDGRTVARRVPPSPGLRARWAARREVVVIIDPGSPPRRCRGTFANVLVDDHDDPYPPVARTVRLRRGGVTRVTIPLFDQMEEADTARASVGTARGRLSSTAEVAIVP